MCGEGVESKFLQMLVDTSLSFLAPVEQFQQITCYRKYVACFILMMFYGLEERITSGALKRLPS